MNTSKKRYVVDIDTDLDTLFGTEGRYGPEGKTRAEVIAEQEKNMTPGEREGTRSVRCRLSAAGRLTA